MQRGSRSHGPNSSTCVLVFNDSLAAYTIELSEDGGEEPAGRAPVGGEVEGDDLLPLEGRVRCHHALVPPQNLLPGKTVHLGNQSD